MRFPPCTLLPALLLVATSVARSQGTGTQPPGAIAGRVVDSATGSALIAASVGVTGTRLGAIVDTAGRFRIAGVPAGNAILRVRLVGYLDLVDTVTVRGGETVDVELRLTASALRLGAVRTEAKAVEREIFDERPNVGVTTISGKAIANVPRLAEADLLRAAQLLPGVQAKNDFSAGLNVRGGEADQNLILIDGFPIFNPFHFGGVFGTFIDAAVDDLTLLTGGFPARYGGRLSAVLDVHSTEDAREGIHGSSTVSLLASNAVLSGALPRGRGNWMVGARRTYADAVFKLFGKDLLPYYFADLQAHAVYRPTTTTSISLTAYRGRDQMTVTDTGSSDAFRFFWGNTVLGATAETKLLDGRLPLLGWRLGELGTLRTSLSTSRFATGLNVGGGALDLDNHVEEIRLGSDLEVIAGRHTRLFGFELTRDKLNYDVTATATSEAFLHRAQRPVAGALYVSDSWKPTDKLLVDLGARAEFLAGSGWWSLQPRVSGKYFLTSNVALTGAVGQYGQWLHSLAREDIPIRLFDFWMSSDATTPVSTATHAILGTEAWLNARRFVRVEGYAKHYGSLAEPNPSPDPQNPNDDFVAVRGNSYGLDVLVRQLDQERWSGWIAYTLGFNRRSQDTTEYFPSQDRRHNLNLVTSYRLSDRTSLSARFGFATGTPFTDIIGEMIRRRYNVRTGQWINGNSGEEHQVVGGPRNARRYPPTQRLDVSVTRAFGTGRTVTPFLSVINLYNAKNVFLYSFDYEVSPPTRTAYAQLPLVPTFGVTVTW